MNLTPLQIEIFRAHVAGHEIPRIIEALGTSQTSIYGVLKRIREMADMGLLDQEAYDRLLPPENWSMTKRDKATGTIDRAFDDATPLPTKEILELTQPEVEDEVISRDAPEHVLKLTGLKPRDERITLKYHDGTNMTQAEIGDEEELGDSEVSRVIKRSKARIKLGVINRAGTQMREQSTEISKLDAEFEALSSKEISLRIDIGIYGKNPGHSAHVEKLKDSLKKLEKEKNAIKKQIKNARQPYINDIIGYTPR